MVNKHTSLSGELALWLANTGRKKRTVLAYVNQFKLLHKKLVTLSSLKSTSRYLEEVRVERSTSTYNNIINFLRVYNAFCKEKGYRYSKKLLKAKFIKDRYRPRATMSDSEIEDFLAIEKPKNVKQESWDRW